MPRLLAFLAVAWLTFGAAAHAETYRQPKTGAPAFVVDAPPASTGAYDQQNNLVVQLDDKTGAVQFTMIEGDEAGLPLPEMAARIFKAAEQPPYTHTEASTIAGYPAQSFTGIMTVNGVMLDMAVTIAKLDASHAAVLSVLRRQNLTPAQSAAVNAVIARAALVR